MITTEKELGEALKRGDDTIEIEIKLGEKVLKIKACNKAVWGACIVCITIAVAAAVVIITTGGTAAPVSGPASVVALGASASILGMPAAVTATGIAIAGGGVGVLNKLRKYRVDTVSDTKVVLHKK